MYSILNGRVLVDVFRLLCLNDSWLLLLKVSSLRLHGYISVLSKFEDPKIDRDVVLRSA